jgi:hypothetical protein
VTGTSVPTTDIVATFVTEDDTITGTV